MSYLYWPSGVPGNDIASGPYKYADNIHITDGSTLVNANSIKNGLGKEIAILQNYLSTNKFLSGIPIGTGYFYSLGTINNPINNVYINEAYVYQTSKPSDSDVIYSNDYLVENLTTEKAILGNNINECKTVISGYFKGFAFEFTSGILTLSGYWDTVTWSPYPIRDVLNTSGNLIVISDTPIKYLNSYKLNNDIYAKRIYINQNATGVIDRININDGIFGNINRKDISYNSTKTIALHPNFTSSWNPFQYTKPYHFEKYIIFNDINGHSFGEGDISLLENQDVTLSGVMFTNFTFRGTLETSRDWIPMISSTGSKKFKLGHQYKDSFYVAEEDWGSGCTNIWKYHPSSGFSLSTVLYVSGSYIRDMGTYKDTLYVLYGSSASGVLFIYNNDQWLTNTIIGSGFNSAFSDDNLYITTYNYTNPSKVSVYNYDGSSLTNILSVSSGYAGTINKLYDNYYISIDSISTLGGRIYKYNNYFTLLNTYVSAFDGMQRNSYFNNNIYSISQASGSFYINKFTEPSPHNYGTIYKFPGSVKYPFCLPKFIGFNNSLYYPLKSGIYDYITINNDEVKFHRLSNSVIESFFRFKNLLLANVSGKIYKTNDEYSNILEKNTYVF